MSKFKCTICGAPTDNDQSFTTRNGFHLEVHRCDKCDKRFHQELNWESEGESIREEKIVCPFCGHEYEDYSGYEFDEGRHEETECECCGRKFDLEVEVSRTYSTKRSLCEMPEDYGEEEED